MRGVWCAGLAADNRAVCVQYIQNNTVTCSATIIGRTAQRKERDRERVCVCVCNRERIIILIVQKKATVYVFCVRVNRESSSQNRLDWFGRAHNPWGGYDYTSNKRYFERNAILRWTGVNNIQWKWTCTRFLRVKPKSINISHWFGSQRINRCNIIFY